MPRRWFRRLFVNRDVFYLWTGQVISQTGTSIYRLAFVWLVVALTGSNTKAGLIAMMGSLPALLLGPYSGALVDKLDRRRTMMVADLARAGLVATIPLMFFVGVMNVWLLGLVTFAVACFTTLFLPARDTLVGQIVAPADRHTANTMIQTSWQYAALAGPAIAGLVLVWISQADLFLLDAASYVVSFAFILRIAASAKAFHRPKLGEFLRLLTGCWDDTIAGVKYVASRPALRALLIVTAVDNLFLMGPAVLGGAMFVKDVLGLDLKSFAFVSIATAIGMTASSLILTRVVRRLKLSRLILWGIVFDGITFVPMLWVHSFAGMFVTMMIHATAIPLIIVCRPTIIQNIVPAEMQGRVFSLISVAVIGFTALSIVLTGVVADLVSIPVIYAGSGLLAASTGALGYVLAGFRELD